MAGKSEEDLRQYITNASRYQQEAVNAEIEELKLRGLSISEEEQKILHSEIIERSRKNSIEHFGWSSENIIADENAPLFYSQKAIWIFSTLFSALAGTILLLSNIKRSKDKKGYTPVLIFGISYTILSLFCAMLVNMLTKPSIFPAFILGGLGALILNNIFWKKYLSDLKYRKRSVLVPTLLCVGICVLFILLQFITAPRP
ncbi:MAG: hypothetical protein ACTHKV_11990 [Flavipsychrobacter sp.]